MSHKLVFFIGVLLATFLLPACTTNTDKLSFEERMLLEYSKNGREARFYELKSRYNSRLVLYLNKNEDRSWIVNFTAWLSTLIIDIPDIIAIGSILAIIQLVAWFISVILTGGGLLAVLAYIGSLFGGIPGIPPAIAGIIYLAIIFKIMSELFSAILGWS